MSADFMDDPARMPSTLWTFIGRVRAGDAREFDRFVVKYRPPVLAFVRRTLRDREEAEDVVQDIFVTLFQDDVLSKADEGKGRLRSLLLAVARHVMSERHRADSAQRRGGGRKPLSLDVRQGESGRLSLEAAIPGPSTDDTFDPLWVENLLRLGMSRLEEECAEKKTSYFTALFAHVNDGLGYAAIAEKLGVGVTDIKNYVHQARLRLRRYVLREIQDYSYSASEYEEESAYLMRFLR